MKKSFFTIIAVGIMTFLGSPATASGIRLELPAYEGHADGLVRIPVILSDAAGLASIRIQINFDPSLLVLQEALAGELGEEFDFMHDIDGGTITLGFVNEAEMPPGGGILAELLFRANAGAGAELYSDLTIAVFEVGDASGVVDLAATRQLSVGSGSVAISTRPAIDNRGIGMPDQWLEEHGINPLRANPMADTDGDGIPDVMEFAFGGNPRVPNSTRSTPDHAVAEVGEESYLTLSFRRPKKWQAVQYDVQESSDLVNWTTLPLSARIVGVPRNVGNDLEEVTIQATEPVDGAQKQFLRVRVRW